MLRQGNRHLQLRVLRHDEPEVVIHRRAMGVAFLEILGPGADAGKEFSMLIDGAALARDFVKTNARGVLTEFRLRFAANGVFHPGTRHQIAFVTRIDVGFRAPFRSVGEGDAADFHPAFNHSADARSIAHLDSCFLEHFEIHALRHAGFEIILGGPRAVAGTEAAVELVCESTDGPLQHVLALGGIDAAGAESADVFRGLDQHHLRPLAGGGNRGRNTARHAAVNQNISLSTVRHRDAKRQKNQEQQAA